MVRRNPAAIALAWTAATLLCFPAEASALPTRNALNRLETVVDESGTTRYTCDKVRNSALPGT